MTAFLQYIWLSRVALHNRIHMYKEILTISVSQLAPKGPKMSPGWSPETPPGSKMSPKQSYESALSFRTVIGHVLGRQMTVRSATVPQASWSVHRVIHPMVLGGMFKGPPPAFVSFSALFYNPFSTLFFERLFSVLSPPIVSKWSQNGSKTTPK